MLTVVGSRYMRICIVTKLFFQHGVYMRISILFFQLLCKFENFSNKKMGRKMMS